MIIEGDVRRRSSHSCRMPVSPLRPLFMLVFALVAASLATAASSHEYVDYFDLGETRLSPQGYRIAREVAAYAAQVPSTVVITAHEDGFEATARADERLDLWRAREMMLELMRLGVPGRSIKLQVKGASQLARARPEGSAEPLNRRLTVDVDVDSPRPPGPPDPVPPGHMSQPRVYFDTGSTEIGRAFLFQLQLATIGVRPGEVQVFVRAHADTLGAAGPNRDLSLRRAEAVARALVKLGIQWADIEIRADGEMALSKRTADGVPEPQNRVVSVDVRPRDPHR